MQSFEDDNVKTALLTDIPLQLTLVVATCVIMLIEVSVGQMLTGGICLYTVLKLIFTPRPWTH